MFTVYNNNKKARQPEHDVDESWNNCEFPTFEEAKDYADKWLGKFSLVPSDWDGSPFDYNGYGDIIEIRPQKPNRKPLKRYTDYFVGDLCLIADDQNMLYLHKEGIDGAIMVCINNEGKIELSVTKGDFKVHYGCKMVYTMDGK